MRLGGTYATNRVWTAGLDNIATRAAFSASGYLAHSATKHCLLGRGASRIEPPRGTPGKSRRATHAWGCSSSDRTKGMERAIDTIRP